MTINELFTAITTSRIDVEDMIAKATDKEAEFKHIMWHIPTGLRYLQDETMKANIGDFINKVATELNVNKNIIFNEDGLITDIEALGGGSKIEVEVKPTEKPSEEPSEEPTERPTEPVEIPTPTPVPTDEPEDEEHEENNEGEE